MKNLLNYQTSEYDCGPVSIINGIRFLFDREDIFPDVIKFIMLYSMDTYNESGELCKQGTSPAAMNYIASWLNHFGQIKGFPIACEFLSGKEVFFAPESKLVNALRLGGVAVIRLYLEVGHYVLLTGIQGDNVLVFDPYYEEESDPDFDKEYYEEGISFIHDRPKEANRLISFERLNRMGKGFYEMGEYPCREALIMYRETTD